MKTRTILGLVILFIGITAYRMVDDVLARLGMQQSNAQYSIIRMVIGRFGTGPMETGVEDGPANSIYKQKQAFRLPYVPQLAAVIAGDKTGIAKDLCEYVRKYINSEEFIAEYERLREEAMPLRQDGMTLSNLKQSKEVFETNIRNYKSDTKYVAEQQKKLDENQVKLDAILEAAKKNFPGKAEWEQAYPTDPAILVKKRLQEYLALVPTVDFNATLTGKGSRQTFVNPVYEKKSLKWKAIFRAGKEVNDVVTAFVKEWLKGEIIAKEKGTMANYKDTKSPGSSSGSNNSNATPASNTEPAVEKAKEKKSLFKKLKEKIGQ